MFGVTTLQGGLCQAFPDTCKTPAPPAPPVPIPYPNVAMCNQATPATCSQKVTVLNQPVLHQQSEIPMSSGDEAGAAGGVVSGQIKGPAAYRSASVKVKVEGKAVVFHTAMVGQNGKSANAPVGVQVAPSQTKVVVTG
jgi:hypothetical protein